MNKKKGVKIASVFFAVFAIGLFAVVLLTMQQEEQAKTDALKLSIKNHWQFSSTEPELKEGITVFQYGALRNGSIPTKTKLG